MRRPRLLLACLLALLVLHPLPLLAKGDANPLAVAVEQRRHVIDDWEVVTEFLNGDGRIARTVRGTYHFSAMVPDRVVMGRSEIAELKQVAGIHFFVNPKTQIIEMVSVGADGQLWRMAGAAGDEIRHTEPFKSRDGNEGRLRFTRHNVQPDSFESRLEYTADGGLTWKPGNHQRFLRRR